MEKQKIKQIILCLLALVAARIPLADCYPLVPGVFVAVFLEGGYVNRSLLFLCSLLGTTLFLPVVDMAKYAVILFVSGVAIKLAEWAGRGLRTRIGALLGSLSTLSVIAAGELWEAPLVRGRAGLVLGVLEAVFVFAFTMMATPVIHLFLEGRRGADQEKRRAVRAPETGERLRSYAESFSGLARLFSRMSQPKEGMKGAQMQELRQEITGKLCISCDQCALCWEQKSSPLYEIFYHLLSSLEQKGIPDPHTKERLSQYCPYSSAVIEEALGVFEKARLNLAWHNRLLENREVIAQQLDAMAYIMEDCAKEYADITEDCRKISSAIRYRLKERGVSAKELKIYEKKNGRLSLRIKLAAKRGNYVSLREISKAISEAMKIAMAPVKDSLSLVGNETTTLIFEEEPKFHALYGVARQVKDGTSISGDNFSFLDITMGESVLTLSDGMGSGIRACKESELVIELIEKFLEAGFQKETAIQMMNSAMVMQGEEGMYSTVDMAAIDLYAGACEFYKIGASTTFLKHGEEVETVSSSSLPVGLFPQVEIERSSRQLQSGDFIVMVSDGVIDDLCLPSAEESVKEMLETAKINNPGQLAKQVLDQVLICTGGKARDDMTVLVAGIWHNG